MGSATAIRTKDRPVNREVSPAQQEVVDFGKLDDGWAKWDGLVGERVKWTSSPVCVDIQG